MKVSKLKKDRILNSWNNEYENIQVFGDNNDYPQDVIEVLYGSVTGLNCANIYQKFLLGGGFREGGDVEVNRFQTYNDLLHDIAHSLAIFNGFYLHFNYNALYQITSIKCLPFETMRFGAMDRESGAWFKYAMHPDWGRRLLRLHNWNSRDIVYFDRFDPRPEAIESQVANAGGWYKYKGQVMHFNPENCCGYALPIYRAALTDMSTEAGLCNVSYRSVRTNFLTSGLLVTVGGVTNETQEQEVSLSDTLEQLQGDVNTCKIATTEVSSKEEMPTFVDFKPTNFDKEFNVTNNTVKDRIGRAFMQPPILRSEDVGNNFGAQVIENAYVLYNSITSPTRRSVEKVINKVNKLYANAYAGDLIIKALEYRKTYTAGDLIALVNAGIVNSEDAKRMLDL